MPLSDNRFTVNESTGDVVEPFENTTIATLDTVSLSDDDVKSAILDWAVSEWQAGRQERALSTIGLLSAENIDRIE